jgi:hypothetical protein
MAEASETRSSSASGDERSRRRSTTGRRELAACRWTASLVAPAALLASGLGSAGCQPAAFPRTAEIAETGTVVGEVALQAVAFEPQRTITSDGRALSTKAAFFPAVGGAARVGFHGCELGGIYALTRLGPEVRCGLLRERRGHPLSVALSGAAAVDYGPYLGAFGRVGLDVSRRAGPVTAIVDAYLSTSKQYRYMQDPAKVPIEGPLPGALSLVRNEIRLTLPVGIGFNVGSVDSTRVTLVAGVNPYFVLHAGACQDSPCQAKTYEGERGGALTLGFELHRRDD